MWEDSKYIVDACSLCQRTRRGRRPRPGELQLVTIGYPNETVSCDWTGPIGKKPTDRGNSYLLAMVDNFTGACELYAAPTNSAATTAECFVDYVSRWGAPRRFVTGRGREFVNQVIKRVNQVFFCNYHYTNLAFFGICINLSLI